jgi:hypothetical protein
MDCGWPDCPSDYGSRRAFGGFGTRLVLMRSQLSRMGDFYGTCQQVRHSACQSTRDGEHKLHQITLRKGRRSLQRQ